MGRRTLLLIVSVLLASIGVGLVALYTRGAQTRADARAEQKYGPRPALTTTPSPSPTNRHLDLEQELGITVEVADPDRAIGLLQPDDLVSIYAADRTGPKDRPVADRVKVVSVGIDRTVNGRDGEQIPNTILGLAVTRAVAQQIWHAEQKGKLLVGVLGVPSRPGPSATPTDG